ncbi:CU044_2847 family protein [Streptosporangium sp. NPDC000095]|uniref:CU044_2847 family protein n=1 Tax=Streptosporangium sp. NPDC000095 TaxID=3366184 RepID=UPI003686C506
MVTHAGIYGRISGLSGGTTNNIDLLRGFMVVVAAPNASGHGVINIELDEFETNDHASIYDDDTRGALEKPLEISRHLFSEALQMVANCAHEARNQIEAMEEKARPDEFEMQLAVKVDGKVGAKIVELSSGAQIMVTLRWRKPAP